MVVIMGKYYEKFVGLKEVTDRNVSDVTKRSILYKSYGCGSCGALYLIRGRSPGGKFGVACECGDFLNRKDNELPMAPWSVPLKSNIQAPKIICTKRSAFTKEFFYAARHHEYSKAAKQRKLGFKLSVEDFVKLKDSNCHYCGVSSEDAKMGFDRLNSNGFYEKKNVVPCCAPCNRAKHVMSVGDFNSYISRFGRRVNA